MSSHVHDGLIAGIDSPDAFYRSAHTRYAQYYQGRFDTVGPIFGGRPKNWAVSPAKLARMVAYHHRNPVEAGIVEHAAQSTWTSHRAFLRLDPAPSFLDVEWAMEQIGFDDTPGGRRSFDEFVRDFGFDAYQEKLEAGEEQRLVLGRAPACRLDEDGAAWLLHTVAWVCSVSVATLRQGRCRRSSHARRLLACVLAQRFAGTLTDAARLLGQSRTTLVNLVKRSSRADHQRVRAQAEIVIERLPAYILAQAKCNKCDDRPHTRGLR